MGLFDGFRLDTLLKRVCKSLLKKRLGDLILGDLDLDQFDIQLGRGTVQLNDLALNADLINRKLSGSPIMLKEGSIKSLLVRFAASCEIVVEELELVLSPSVASEVVDVHNECSVSGCTSDTQTSVKTQRYESDSNQCSTSVSRDVDEGVKRIANAVKWFLTRFNIKLKNVYVVFDPQTSLDSRLPETNRSLVFRIKELEFGTHLGQFKLDNFLTFHEAVIELLKMDDVDALLQNDPVRGTTDISACHSTTAVLTGPIGGFSGKLNLSIPWNKGCLNFEKIDADVSVDSLELRLQISSIRWIMNVWDSLQRKPVDEQNSAHNAADISISSFRSTLCSPASSSLKSGSDSVIGTSECLAHSTFSQSRQEKIQDSFLTRAYVITDWMEPVASEDQGDPDSDCDESIDQFFECFEELRNSQSSLGNSGIWDWTCSVFNAISFASTLASGSDQVPKEPVIEKTLRASVAEVSVLLLFSDDMDIDASSVPVSALDDMRNSEMFSSCLSSQHFEKSIVSPATASSLNMHHLEAKCQKIHLDLQTYPENVRFKASIAQVKLDEYYHAGNNNSDDSHLGNHFLNNNLRQGVQASLPQCLFAAGDPSVETYELCGNNSCELIKVELLKTFGECTFHYDVSTKDQDGNLVSSTSMSICLAPLVLWVHFHTLYMLLSFISKVESDLSHGEHKIHMHGDDNGSRLTTSTGVSSNGSLKVQISMSPARIILCFPSEFQWDLSHPSVLDKFLVIDHTSCLNVAEAASHPQNEFLNEVHLGKPCTSIRLATGNFDIYLVKPANDVLDGRVCSSSRQTFSTMKIFSVTGASCNDSGITLIRRKYPVTCPEMVSKAWSLAKLHDQLITKKQNSKWAGISPSTAQDLEETGSSMRQELIKSSELLLHVKLSCVSVQVCKKDCGLLNKLLDHVLDGISNEETSTSENCKDKSVPNDICIQTSVIFECSILEICTELDETVEVGPLLQTELEGSWSSLKLKVSNFSLFSYSNVGRLNNASFLWVNHGEAELWGSVSVKDDKVPGESKDFLIVVCKDSACRRGDGEGTNVLSIGTAGCSVTHIRNPKLKENYTSVGVRSGTIVAPGGRMDWINAMCLLFSSGSDGTGKSDNSNTVNSSRSGEPYASSFFLELTDVAVSYEPHFKYFTLTAEATDPKFFSCILAASSFKLHNKSSSASAATDFDIQLRDLGVLLSESSGSKNVTCGYGVDYLRQAGYVKVAQNTFIEASLRIDSSFWKLEILDSQFDIATCRDTTYGLIRLGSQLQQLYGPDMRDALDHLQSRWNSVQQANKQNIAADASDKSESSLENMTDSGDCQSDGLLDDIIENAFYTEDYMANDFWESNCCHSVSSSETDDGFELNTATSHVLLRSSLVTSETNVTQIPLRQDSCPDQIIDSYYMPELHQSSSAPCIEEHKCTSGGESEDGGWYNNVPLTIVENHVSKKKSKKGEQILQQEVKASVCHLNTDDESCNLKGKILIHDIDVKWRLYAGNDWLLPQKDPTSFACTDGRDRSSSLEFSLTGLSIQLDMYPDGDVSISKLSIAAQDLSLCDQSIHAPWKLVLGCYNSKDYPRESCSSVFRFELESVRPEPHAPLEDYRLHLEILPLQLHLDQGQLNFLIKFFQNDLCNNDPHLQSEKEIFNVKSTSYGRNTVVDEALLPFFQKFDVKPLVLHINYIPRQFDPIALGKGNYAELLNILPWKEIC
ncbi:autophagy-related protein 2 isoform X2 [Setaria viridis]|uniref:autophagy-related protein 2 isoform X2 n=1 Tax=Setaria viridis TaxID=4556 RepID=UPI003B3A2328